MLYGNPLFADGLASILRRERGLKIESSVNPRKKGLTLIKTLRPDVVIIEGGNKTVDASSALRELLKHSNDRVLTIQVHADHTRLAAPLGRGRHMQTYFLLSFLLLLAGCSSLSLPSLPWSQPALESSPAAEAVFKEGMDHFKKKRYPRAIHFFERVRDKFPFSSPAVEAELKIAEAHYLNKEHPEAIMGFKDFLALHPTHEKKPIVIYHLGLAHFDQFNGIDRDQKNTEIAIGYFKTVIKDHPNSAYAAEAKEKLVKCREYLAEHEMNVATFYLREKEYQAAIDRFEEILRRYGDTPTAVRALYQLGESYRLQKNTLKAALAYQALIQHYPDNPLAEKARTELGQLDKEKHDPLAMLLMRDGRPVSTPPLPQQSRRSKDLKLVAKKEVVREEPGAKKGIRRIIDMVNPFAWKPEIRK